MEDNQITLGFAGDFCLSGFENRTESELLQSLSEARKLTSQCDFSIANFEFCLLPENKNFNTMALSERKAKSIVCSGFDAFCLANNHIKDYGAKFLLFTQRFLEQQKILTIGAGENLVSAQRPLIKSINGFKLGILNITDANHYSANDSEAGVAPLKRAYLHNSVKNLSDDVDCVIVIIHSDLEFTNSPAPWRVALSRKLVENGTDIVIHHHSHTLQGIEYHQGKLIAYSLGNFIFPLANSPYMKDRPGGINESVFLEVNIDVNKPRDKRVSHQVIATYQDDKDNFYIANEIKADQIKKSLNEYSELINQPAELRSIFFSLCLTEMKRMLKDGYYCFRRDGIKTSYQYFKHHFTTDQHRNWLRGFFTFGKY